MDTWQRGTSFTNTANSYQYTADRWIVFGGVGIPAASSRVSTGLQNFPYALRVQRPAANTGTANTLAGQVIETINCRDLSGQTTTVSFLARAGANYSTANNRLDVILVTGTGTDQGAQNGINNAWTTQAYNTQSVTLTTSFVQYSLTFTVPVGTNEIMFYFITTPSGTAGAADYFDITGVQYEKGSVATSFDVRPYGTELALCQRYYLMDTYTVAGGNNRRILLGGMYASTQWEGTYYFLVQMRAAPTLTTSAGSTFWVNATTPTSPTSIAAYIATTLSSLVYTANPAFGTAGYATSLCSNSTNGTVTFLAWNAEL
jgi:hypothetical protein